MTGLSVGSVCSGIGAFELAARAVGLGPVKWQVEIDPYCRAVLARHWPDAVRYEDLTDVSTRPADLESVDIICGGTPCQDMSSAGAKAGIEGARSSLWFHMLAVVAHVRPRFVVWENVRGSIRRGMERVVEGLDAVGYEVVGTQLSAADVGAPHRRARVFVVGFSPDAAGGAWPTPTVKGNYNRKGLSPTSGDGLATAVSRLEDSPGPLNPPFLEWLMGFPLGWTESEPLETPSSCATARSPCGSSATSGKEG